MQKGGEDLLRGSMGLILSSITMLLVMVVLTWGFRDLPIAERPEWMVVQGVLWPSIVLGVVEIGKLRKLRRAGFVLRAHFSRLGWHGLPAIVVAMAPTGFFTKLVGAQSMWALLDYPTAKVLAAFWVAVTIWSSWEIQL